jgi:hypothetical protein
MTEFPLLYSFRRAIYGNGFVAGVEIKGHALASVYDDGLWISAVTPGGFGEGAANLEEARSAFFNALGEILSDFASESASFAEFQAAVGVLAKEVDRAAHLSWTSAVARVRSGNENYNSLPKVSADDWKPTVEVKSIDHLMGNLTAEANDATKPTEELRTAA